MILRYLRLAVWPGGLVVDYGTPRAIGLGDVVPQAVLVLGLIVLTVWALVRRPMIGFLGSVVLHDTFTDLEYRADRHRGWRRTPHVSAAGRRGHARRYGRLLASGTGEDRGDLPNCTWIAGAAALAVVVILLGGATIARNREYASAVMLARVTFERWPTARTQHSLGAALVADKQYQRGHPRAERGRQRRSRRPLHAGCRALPAGQAS